MDFAIRPDTYLVRQDKNKFLFYSLSRKILIDFSSPENLTSVWSQLLANGSLASEQTPYPDLLNKLYEADLLEKKDDQLQKNSHSIWEPFVKKTFKDQSIQNQALARIQSTKFSIRSLWPIDMSSDWKNKDFSISDQFQFVIVYGLSIQNQSLLELNNEFVNKKINWLPIVVDEFGGQIGPLLGPSYGLCYECIALRKKDHQFNAKLQEPFNNIENLVAISFQDFPDQIQQLTDIAQMYLVKSLIHKNTENVMLKISLTDFEMKKLHFIPHSNCEVCKIWT